MPAVGVEGREAPDVDVPKIERSFAVDDPLGDELAGAAGIGDARGIESGADEEAAQFGRLAENEITVRSKTLRTVQERLHFRGFQARRAMDRVPHQDLEVVPILRQKLEFEIVRDGADVPRFGDRLEATHDQAADFLLVIDVAVGVAHDRQVRAHARDRAGDDVEMLRGIERYVCSGQSAEFARPLSRAIGDRLAAHLSVAVACAVAHARDMAAFDDYSDELRILDDSHAAHPGTAGERLGQIGGIRLAVAGNPDGAREIVGAQERIDLPGFCG